MEITKMQTRAFWKGEVGIDGQVTDQGKEYEVRLEVKGSYVNSYSCSCCQGNSYKEMCPHEKALFEYYQQQAAETFGQPVSTSSQVRAMIREYTNREVARIMQETQEETVRFLPGLMISRHGIQAQFSLGRERLYVVKDLTAFARAMEQGAYVEYGKSLAFHHSRENFAGECQELLSFVMELMGTYREHYEQFHKSVYASVPSVRELNISRSNRDRFFGILTGGEAEVQDGSGTKRRVRIVKENPEIVITVKKAGKKGLRVSMDKSIVSFNGEKYLYVLAKDKLYICDEEFTRDGAVFFSQMTQGYEAPYEVTVNEKDVPLFYERVLRHLERYGILETKGVELEKTRPVELKARFVLESPQPGEVVLHPTLSYGDYSFHPVEDEHVPRTICRDVPGEFRVSQVLTKYFKYRDPQTDDLVIRDDEEGLFRLLSEGVEELRALGEVYFPQGENHLRIMEPPKVSVGVKVSGQWLELTINAGDMTTQELMEILNAYRLKKKYCRLKDGEFLKLEDNGLMAMARIVDGLALPEKGLSKNNIQIPRYRALYLDSLCREREDIRFTRDQMYKSIIRGMKSVADSDFEVPAGFDQVLRGYQKIGFKWLRTLDALGFGGILADDMGLGKTIQIISVLYDEAVLKGDSCPSLIVCPASLVYNWQCEMETFAPTLKVLVAAGSSHEREEKLKRIRDYHVVITSYDLLKRDLPLYEPYSFRFQVIDEAQYIKNPLTQTARAVKKIRSQARYALTGTPVENRLSELWSIFDYLMPGFLFSYARFKKQYETPIVKEEDREALKRLQLLTGPFILRRLKWDVLKELPEKLETVVYSRMEEEQKKLYTANAWQLKKHLEERSKIEILSALTRIRQVCCDPRLIYEGYGGGSAKLETCVELVRSGVAGDHKILLFSQFTSMLDLIGERLAKEGIKYHVLTGATPKEERIRTVNAFYKDDVPVFLISLKAGGTGLNLTAADMVIHYDPWWNVAAQNQATDRAHRIGQEKQVSVFQLITKDTIEENILKLQRSKQALAEQVVTEGMVSLGGLSQEEILELLN